MSNELETKKLKTISYTQYNMWSECPFRWYQNYICKNRVKSDNINTIFGRAMHEVLQHYLTVMYEKTISIADAIDLPSMLLDRMRVNFAESRKDNPELNVTKEELIEFFEDGCEIIYWFLNHKSDYFTKRGFALVGVEVPIELALNSGVVMQGFLDVVIRDTVLNRIKIYDFKTSRQGWNKYQKADKRKTAQLILYKTFYAKQYGYDPKNVDVEFLVLKRKLYEKCDFPQKRIQKISPASGSITMGGVLVELKEFIDACFDAEGNYRTDVVYEKRPSVKACKYCEFDKLPAVCDKNNPKRAAKLLMEKQNGQ